MNELTAEEKALNLTSQICRQFMGNLPKETQHEVIDALELLKELLPKQEEKKKDEQP